MMKRFLALALSVAMTLTLMISLIPPTRAAVTPTPPSWVRPEEYAVYPDGVAYEPDIWNSILILREHAAAGNALPRIGEPLYEVYEKINSGRNASKSSVAFERGLLYVQYYRNARADGRSTSYRWLEFLNTWQRSEPGSREGLVALTWYTRLSIIELRQDGKGMLNLCANLYEMQKYPEYNLEELLDRENVVLQLMTPQQEQTVRQIRMVTLDGMLAYPYIRAGGYYGQLPEVRNGRTMVPLRRIAELLGAEVLYDNDTRQITMNRGSETILLTVGSTTAYRNGKSFTMDVAPYIHNNLTYIPVRYVAEFFGQTVNWDNDSRVVTICEDKDAVKPSNLEAWALPMGAMLNYINIYKESVIITYRNDYDMDPEMVFGGVERADYLEGPFQQKYKAQEFANERLAESWGIYDREGLIDTVQRMTTGGHNADFQFMVEGLQEMPSSEYNAILREDPEYGQFLAYTKQIARKWGDRGILCWDLFRMSNLVQWGYLCGYVTYPEALALLEPAAKLLQENFSSWKEAYENYLDGYLWWSGEGDTNTNVWETERGKVYEEMKQNDDINWVFDDDLFDTGVIGVPGLSAEDL